MLPPIRKLIARETRRIFAEPGVEPGERSAALAVTPQSLFPADAVSRRVHGDVGSMMIGGFSALMMQMLHPGALAGVWDHSDFRADMHGRLRRTARFIAITTYGTRDQAAAVVARIRGIHDHVAGTLPDGTPYSANDPGLLTWVHVAGASSFLAAYRRYVEPAMRRSDQDLYYSEVAAVARMLGARDVPESVAETDDYLSAMRGALRSDARTREIVGVLVNHRPARRGLQPLQAITAEAAIDLLPGWARRMHGYGGPRLQAPLVRAGAFGLAGTLRWALR